MPFIVEYSVLFTSLSRSCKISIASGLPAKKQKNEKNHTIQPTLFPSSPEDALRREPRDLPPGGAHRASLVLLHHRPLCHLQDVVRRRRGGELARVPCGDAQGSQEEGGSAVRAGATIAGERR